MGRTGEEGAFRALARGFTHWASGRLEQMEVNIEHPEYCHVRCYMRASMKDDIYKVYILLGSSGNFATVLTATCECGAGYVHSNSIHNIIVLLVCPFNAVNINIC